MRQEIPDYDSTHSECPFGSQITNKPKCFRKLLEKKNYLYSKTAVLVYSWICLGLYSEILGPSLLELRRRTNSNYEEISRTLTARAFGYLIGSTIGGLLNDRFRDKRSFILSASLFSAGVSIALVPWCRQISTLGVVLFVGGVSHGFHTTGGNPSLADLWKEKSSGPFNLMHAGFGGGASLAPLLFRWFSVRNITQKITTFNGTTTSTDIDVGFLPLIENSYLVVAITCWICALLFGFFGYLGNPLEEIDCDDADEDKGNASCGHKVIVLLKQYMNCTKISMILIILLLYFFIVGNERVFGKFLYSYAVESDLKMNPSKAYILNSIYWVCFCGARLLTSLVLYKYSVKGVFFSQIVVTLLTAMMLNMFPETLFIFLIFSAVYGLAKSPLFPTGLGIINGFLEVNGIITAVLNVGSAMGAMSMQYLTGSLIDKYGHASFLYVVLGSATGIFIMGSVILYVADTYKADNPHQQLES